MARDYKNAKRAGGKDSGWTKFFIGLGLGLAVAAGVRIYDKRVFDAQHTAARVEPAPKRNGPAPASQQTETAEQLEFYEQLPKFEVVVPPKGKDSSKAGSTATIDKPGAYVLQAGSFRTFGEADRVKALLALQGVQSRIEKAPIETETWHRVRIGPIRNLQQLDETRRKLREAQIDAIVIRVPD
jgi:cell division protein FtsN